MTHGTTRAASSFVSSAPFPRPCRPYATPSARHAARARKNSMIRCDRCPLDRQLHGHRPPLAHLLAPHRIVKPPIGEQFVVASMLDDAAALEYVNAVGVHDGRQAVSNQDGDGVP